MKYFSAWKIIVLSLLILLVFMLASKVDKYEKEAPIHPINLHMSQYLEIYPQNTIPFYIVMCKGTNKKEYSEQLKKSHTLLKSVATLTRITLSFTIFTDSESVFQDIVSPMKIWSLEHQRRLKMNFNLVRYPASSEEFRKVFKPCATFRLLLPDMMQNVDAAVYIDTDTIFLHPPEAIWKEFYNFNKEEAVALAISTAFTGNRIPFPGLHGFNSGVMLMNLTRLRSAPGGNFTNVMMELFQQYKHKGLKYGDNDLLNIYFHKYPALLMELPCNWNYHIDYCKDGRNGCLESAKYGASLVHGAGRTFLKKGSFQDLCEAWEEYELGTPIKTLVMKIHNRISKHKSSHKGKICTNADNITYIYTNQLSLNLK